MGDEGEGSPSATLQFEDTSIKDEACDFVVLSGPITNYVRGSNDKKVHPILDEVSVGETSLFYSKQAMQFLISLVEFEDVPGEFQALEFWPTNFQKRGSVIVRRDIEIRRNWRKSHKVGGIQSFSYYPYLQCNRSVHWDEQQRWAVDHGKNITKVLGQFYVDTYYFHYSNEDVMAGKVWDLDDLQIGDGVCNCTLYVGGCASYETVEDSMHYNLKLVDKLIDQVDEDLAKERKVERQLLTQLPKAGTNQGLTPSSKSGASISITATNEGPVHISPAFLPPHHHLRRP